MSDPKLTWLAWENQGQGDSGYAYVAHRLRTGLQSIGATFLSSYLHGWDLLVAVCTPTAWIIGNTGQKRPDVVYHTMFEADPLPEGWVSNMNNAGLVWTPSAWCRDLFKSSGVTTPILVSGYGVDHHVYKYTSRRDRTGPMKFVVWADILTGRKNALTAIKAFIRAQCRDAILEVKLRDVPGIDPGSSRRFVYEGIARDDIILHVGTWTRSEIVSWLQGADCAIYPSGGEGFGLMPLEAASTGLPTICANNTGMREYLRPDSYLLVDCNEREVSSSYTAGFHESITTLKPDFDQLTDHIRWAYTHRDELWDIGDRAYTHSLDWSWEKKVEEAYTGLKAYWNTIV